MREMMTAGVMAIAVWGLGLSETLWAQEPATIVSAVPQGRPERFLGVDIFAGGGQFQNVLVPATDTEDAKYQKWGWDAGATVSYGVRWLGITASVGHQTIVQNMPAYHVVAGPRVTSPWLISDRAVGRFFGHALVGFARTAGVAPSQSSAEWVFGGGLDLFFARLQIDYVRLNLNGVNRGSPRVFVGGVIPLCLRACSESKDVVNLSGRPWVQ
jgi:hypothetical protein